MFRLKGATDAGLKLFLSYMQRINSLKERPEFYNTLTTNCTTNIWLHAGVNPGRIPFSWKILLSGHVPGYLYDAGRLEDNLPFAELQQRSLINARALAADKAEDFSRRIRAAPAGAAGNAR